MSASPRAWFLVALLILGVLLGNLYTRGPWKAWTQRGFQVSSSSTSNNPAWSDSYTADVESDDIIPVPPTGDLVILVTEASRSFPWRDAGAFRNSAHVSSTRPMRC